MNNVRVLRALGQSVWLDNITRDLLDSGGMRRYIDEYDVTGLTSNPTIFDEAIGNTTAYDASIRDKAASGRTGEALFIELALEDLRRAADLFRPAFEATNGVDGWVSMEISPLLTADTAGSVAAASQIHRQADRANLFVKIPGTPEGVPAIEESIFAGVPINVTLLFSREQYVAAAEAYLRGIERRIGAGRDPRVSSVASRRSARLPITVALHMSWLPTAVMQKRSSRNLPGLESMSTPSRSNSRSMPLRRSSSRGTNCSSGSLQSAPASDLSATDEHDRAHSTIHGVEQPRR